MQVLLNQSAWLSAPAYFFAAYAWALLALFVGYSLGTFVWGKLLAGPCQRALGHNPPLHAHLCRALAVGLCALLQFAIGWLPLLLESRVDSIAIADWGLGMVMLGSITGCVYPLMGRLGGGTGLCVALGALLGVSTIVALLVVASWLALLLYNRTPAVATLLCLLLAPIYLLVCGESWTWVAYACVAGLLLGWVQRQLLCAALKKSAPPIGRLLK